ncbi:hypothetical protein [Granulicoccus sp. GXG6511]|uniref:hypothetical protein n=1 Tax=Granulicoccus sp. GXG6511 TaxID=3381351 RepID=UPI003D7EBBCA
MSDSPRPSPAPGPSWPGLDVTPTLPEDPAKIGDFWLDGRAVTRPSGVAWLAHSGTEDGTDAHRVILVQLAEGAAADKAARDRFSGLINKLHIDDVLVRGGQEQDEGRLGRRFRDRDEPVDPDDLHPIAPWVALAYAGDNRVVDAADAMLADVDLLDLPPSGQPSGPDFRLHWIDRDGPGHNRTWPLPWPGRHDRAGWQSILASMLLMLMLAAVAVLIAILLFKDSPPISPPPQSGQTEQQQSPQPSDSPQSPDTATPSPTPGPSGTPTAGTPTPDPTASAEGGSPTPPSRL